MPKSCRRHESTPLPHNPSILKGRIMAVSQTDIDNLNAAIASGVRSATVGGQTLVYGTVDALIKARDDLLKQLATATKPTRSRQNYAYYSDRGYDR